MVDDVRTCWRCGVDFDGTPYLPGVPCEDCQFDVVEPDIGWLKPGVLKERMQEEYREHRRMLVKYFYDIGYDDAQSADILGLNSSVVSKIRKNDLNLPVQTQVRQDVYDPIGADATLKRRKAGSHPYDHDNQREAREAHARWRLEYGWPEEAAHWAMVDAQEAVEKAKEITNARV